MCVESMEYTVVGLVTADSMHCVVASPCAEIAMYM